MNFPSLLLIGVIMYAVRVIPLKSVEDGGRKV